MVDPLLFNVTSHVNKDHDDRTYQNPPSSRTKAAKLILQVDLGQGRRTNGMRPNILGTSQN